MSIYRNLGNWMGAHPVATLAFGAIIGVGSFYAGKWERAREPSIESGVLVRDDLNSDGRYPDLVIQHSNGIREALYIQGDRSTFLSSSEISKRIAASYKGIEANLNNPAKPENKPSIPQTKPDPIDNPYVIPLELNLPKPYTDKTPVQPIQPPAPPQPAQPQCSPKAIHPEPSITPLPKTEDKPQQGPSLPTSDFYKEKPGTTGLKEYEIQSPGNNPGKTTESHSTESNLEQITQTNRLPSRPMVPIDWSKK